MTKQKKSIRNRIFIWLEATAAVIAIAAFMIDIFTGWPFNELLIVASHEVSGIQSTPVFQVESITTNSRRVLNPGDKFSYWFQLPLEARGATTLSGNEHVWVVLKDEHGGYYLQSPPVEIKEGTWFSYNIRPLHGIRQIIWLKVNAAGHSVFLRKQSNNEWGKFTELPLDSSEIAYATLR